MPSKNFTRINLLLIFILLTQISLPSNAFLHSQQKIVLNADGPLPEITSISPTMARLEMGTDVTITGRNFTKDTIVAVGENLISNVMLEGSTTLRFRLASQMSAGLKTLTVENANGIAQTSFGIMAKPFNELMNGEITTLAGGNHYLGDGDKAINANLDLTTLFATNQLAIDTMGNLFFTDTANDRVRRVDMRTGIITTVAGSGIKGFSGDNTPAIVASLNTPTALAIDTTGNLYIADSGNNRIRRVTPTGIITTFAGNGDEEFKGDGGLAINASLNNPNGLAIDSMSNLFIADTFNQRIRRVDVRTQMITTVAGNGTAEFNGDGGLATKAGVVLPINIALDKAGNLFLVDPNENLIRQVNATTQIISTVAGDGLSDFTPAGLAVDTNGNLLIANVEDNQILRLDIANGILSPIAGSSQPGFAGDGGAALLASLKLPTGVAVDSTGNLFIADSSNNRLRAVDMRTQTINTVAGNGLTNFRGDNGAAVFAALNTPQGIAIDKAGNIFIADTANHRIRRIDRSTGTISTLAGNGQRGFRGDNGPAINAWLNFPSSIALDAMGNLFIADTANHRIRHIDVNTGIISSVAGNGRANFNGDGAMAVNASLNQPSAVVVNNTDLFIVDSSNHSIRRVDARGVITTIVGNGKSGFKGDGGLAVNANLAFPNDLAIDALGNLFIVDSGNNRIRRVSANSLIIDTVAGNGDALSSGDNGPANAASFFPTNVALDSTGNLFIADAINNFIRRVDASTRIITTVAGNQRSSASGDGGLATKAALNPFDITLDAMGNIFTIDRANNSLRAIKASNNNPPTSIMISQANYSKPQLTISGNGFGTSGAKVNLNGRDVTTMLMSQNNTTIILKGNKKKLGLKNTQNQVTVMVGGLISNTFVFDLS